MFSFPVATQDKILKYSNDRQVFTRAVNGFNDKYFRSCAFLVDSYTYITEWCSLDAGQNSIEGSRSTETLPTLKHVDQWEAEII